MMIIREKYLNRLDPRLLNSIARSKGRHYVIGWAHRITGLLLLGYVLLHINTLSTLSNPEIFTRKAEMFSGPLFTILEWLLAVPVIFHCLNGGRLLVYELVTTRYDDKLLSWVGILSVIYMLLLGYFMLLGDQEVSAQFFWLTALVISILVSYPVWQKIRKVSGSLFWKLQRLSASLLFVLVPAHMLFMHLNPAAGRDAGVIAERLSQPLIIFLDGALLVMILYHAAYGVIGIAKDYLVEPRTIKIISAVAIGILALFGLQGMAVVSLF